MSLFGAPVRRKEDGRLLRGRGRYVSDVELPRMLHVAFVRSVHAHARLVRIDTAAAMAAAGVVAVVTGEEPSVAGYTMRARSALPTYVETEQPVLAWPKVRFCGEAVAAVVAADRYLAEDAAGLVAVDYDPLPAVADVGDARGAAAIVHDEAPDNVLLSRRFDHGDVEAALASSAAVVERVFRTNRQTAAPLEGRGGVADWNAAEGKLTLYSGTQVPHLARHALGEILGLPENRVRVVAPDVGGGFGVKAIVYPEDVVLCLLAMRLERPVKWVETRREGFVASAHARDHRYAVRAGFDAAGRLTAMDVRADCNAGAYSVYPWTAGIEALMAGGLLTGPYKLDHYRCEVAALATNTTPAGPYRGVARPATTFVMERVLDLAARALGLDPVEIRRINLVGPGDLPYTSPTRLVHDSPSYPVCFEKVVEAIGYGAFRAEQARLRAEGRYVGIGFASYNELTGLGQAASAGPRMPFPHRPRGRDRADGSVGRGDRARRRDVAGAGDRDHRRPDRRLRAGGGLRGGDRRARGHRRDAVRPRRLRLAPGGHRRWRRHARRAGRARQDRAHRRASARGRPGRPRARRWADRGEGGAGAGRVDARRGARRPPRDQSPARRHGAGTRGHAVLRSDPGHLRRGSAGRRGRGRSRHGNDPDPRYACVEDTGRVINPLIVEGQVLGAIAQGIGGALTEHLVYDAAGQLLTGTLMEYALPTAASMPAIDLDHIEVPADNLIGVRGVGEGGTLGPAAVLANAVADALSPLGVEVNELPLTPARLWTACAAASRPVPR